MGVRFAFPPLAPEGMVSFFLSILRLLNGVNAVRLASKQKIPIEGSPPILNKNRQGVT